MSDIKNLYDEQAVAKVKELVEASSICQFLTNLTSFPISARPMGAMDVDEEGNLWFFSSRGSDKNEDIEKDARVQLLFSNHSDAAYLSIYGEAEISFDKEKAKELWTPMAKAWFEDGVDDPDLSIIKVVPQDAYYWDTKSNKLTTLLKITASAVTGKTMDDGVKGKLKV